MSWIRGLERDNAGRVVCDARHGARAPRIMRHLEAQARQWEWRGRFYEIHRDCFPTLAESPFVKRCYAIADAYRRRAAQAKIARKGQAARLVTLGP